MPKISVIVPVYRAKDVLCRCVESILMQSYTDFEVILVDDGSPDDSGFICDSWAKRDSRIKVIHKENGGVSSARNTGIDASGGDWLAFIDADDYVDGEYLERLLREESDLTICGMQTENQYGQPLYTTAYHPRRFDSEPDYTWLYENRMLYSPYCRLFRGRVVRNHNIRFPAGVSWGEDGMFTVDYLRYVSSVAVLEYVGYHYVKYADNTSLSTKVRRDVVNIVALSREYCISAMAYIAPWHYEGVKAAVTQDICFNCSIFLKKLFQDPLMSLQKKERILNKFLESPYVIHVLCQKTEYFSDDMQLMSCLEKCSTKQQLRAYHNIHRKKRVFFWVYYHVYSKLPQWIKSMRRK